MILCLEFTVCSRAFFNRATDARLHLFADDETRVDLSDIYENGPGYINASFIYVSTVIFLLHFCIAIQGGAEKLASPGTVYQQR